MIQISNIDEFDFESVPVDEFWNTGNEKELAIHKIHAYPAKFPAFITNKAVEYCTSQGLIVNSIGDIFCGCGTTAYESKRMDIDFWGCDINPVATLIAKVKSSDFSETVLNMHLENILARYNRLPITDTYDNANKRLQYWFSKEHYNQLAVLKSAIIEITGEQQKYRDFFLCAFSNILKPTSVWLTKSIKPQVDPQKEAADVIKCFVKQCLQMIKAQKSKLTASSKSKVVTGNFLDNKIKPPKVDLIVTSPPYVTSYEYADLHQLSSTWLEYSEDYRSLREGSIGSLYHDYNFEQEWKHLNKTGNKIVSLMFDKKLTKARSVAKYFLDMQAVVKKTKAMLNADGAALFVIGNTEYKGVRINNAKHLSEALLNAGFKNIFVSKRKISKKILTPYRDSKGKFTTNNAGRKVYNEEFIIVGRC